MPVLNNLALNADYEANHENSQPHDERCGDNQSQVFDVF
jgi:hypothetical protein